MHRFSPNTMREGRHMTFNFLLVIYTIVSLQLCHYGIDLCYQLDGALRNPLTRVLRETKDKLTESVKLRSVDDKWYPMNLNSKQKLARCLQEHTELGIKLDDYVTGICIFM